MPTGLSIALSLLILTHPAPNVHAAGTPTSAETPITSTTKSSSPRSAAGYVYTVQPADTLWDIAVAHGITVKALIAANDLPDPRRLQAGQKIFVPAQPAVVPRKPAAAAPTAPSTPAPEATVAPAPEAAVTPSPPDAPTAAPDTATSEPTPAPEPLAAPGLAPDLIGWPAEILGLVNEKRAAQGVPALAWSAELAARRPGSRRRLRPAQPGQPHRLGWCGTAHPTRPSGIPTPLGQRELGQRAERAARVRSLVERATRQRSPSPQHPGSTVY